VNDIGMNNVVLFVNLSLHFIFSKDHSFFNLSYNEMRTNVKFLIFYKTLAIKQKLLNIQLLLNQTFSANIWMHTATSARYLISLPLDTSAESREHSKWMAEG